MLAMNIIYDSMLFIIRILQIILSDKLENLMGERKKRAIRAKFDRKLKLEFHGVK